VSFSETPDPTPPGDDHNGDAFRVRWVGVDGDPRCVSYLPRTVGGYTRIEERWNGSTWVKVSDEIVADVGLTRSAERLD
jgi:hypothetical protein